MRTVSLTIRVGVDVAELLRHNGARVRLSASGKAAEIAMRWAEVRLLPADKQITEMK